jgi:hypothetical protein
VRPALAALACLFLLAHLPFLPPTFEDIDSVNFALGVQDFDVAQHRPHPPGYPVYMALSKMSAAVLGGTAHAAPAALAIWSVIAGAALVVLLFAFGRALDPAGHRAWWGMAIAVASPLFWFTALRPLSDMTGLAFAIAAQALLLFVLTRLGETRSDRMLAAGAFLAGLAAGVRSQTVLLTGPLLIGALILPRRASARARLTAVAAAIGGVLIWAVPLLVVSGGPAGYAAALGSQAGEDFTGVVMLWTTRTPRVAANALMYTFLWPWGGVVVGGIVCALALIGALRLARIDLHALLWLAVAFAPYAIFHLLFQETATLRYALPLIVPVAFLVATALDWLGRRPGRILSGVLVALLLMTSAGAVRAYGANEAPAFRAMREVSVSFGGDPVGMHAVFRRAAEWLPPSSTVLLAPHGAEWLALVERWRAEPDKAMVFVSDPRRTDLALFDAHARELKGSYRWSFPEFPFVGGVRPGSTDWYVMRPPGWMLDRGWALSAELGGVAARDLAGPHLQPSRAWVRARREPAMMLLGGRNLDASAPAQLSVTRGDRVIDTWTVAPGFFFRLFPLPAASLEGSGYVPVSIRASSEGNRVRVSLEQFDLQPDGVEMMGFVEGWHEPEYNPMTSRSWRWMSERAVLWVRPIASDVTLTLTGESPLRYFDSAPLVGVSVGGQEIARFSPASDFTERVRLPAPALAANDGRVVVETDKWFVPAERSGAADKRHLGIRIYGVKVNH